MIVTFDLFSALTDSRRGASALLAEIARERGWTQDGEELYAAWDGHNKALQRTATPPTTFHDLSREALVRAYADLGLSGSGDVDADLARIEESVADWPLWPDVAAGVAAVARDHRVGILSNVDDALARRTRAYALVDPDLVLTSQRLGAYKPSPELYAAAAAAAPDRLVHVAASGRDVRGALEAGLATVRLVRDGHVVDTAGPQPGVEVTDAADLAEAVERVAAQA